MIDFGLPEEYLEGYNARLKGIPFDSKESDEWQMGFINADQHLQIDINRSKTDEV